MVTMKTTKLITAATPTRDLTLTFVEGASVGTIESRAYGNRALSYPGFDFEWLLCASVDGVTFGYDNNDKYLWVTRPEDGAEALLEARFGFRSVASTQFENSLIHTAMQGLPRGVDRGSWTVADGVGCQWAFLAQNDKTFAVRRDPGPITDPVSTDEISFTIGNKPLHSLTLDITFDDEAFDDLLKDELDECFTVLRIEEYVEPGELTKERWLELESNRILREERWPK